MAVEEGPRREADPGARQAVRPPLLVGAGPDQPARRRGRRGPLLLGLRRQPLPRLRLAARQRLDRPPAPEGRRGDQGAGRQAAHDRAADGARDALRARAAARRGDARRPDDVVLHERRRRGERERDQARALVHGPPQDRSRATAPTTARPAARSRSPATRAAGPPSRGSRASCACSTRTPTAARPAIPIRARSARARRTSRRSSSTRAPQNVAAVIMETIVGTNGIIVPPDGYLQSIREVCDRHGILLICDEVMAGFGRTGKWFAVRATGTSCRTSSPWPRGSTPATCRSAR